MDLNSKKKDKLEYPICNSRNLWRLLAYLRITTKFVLCRTIQLTIKHQNICFNLYNFIVFSVTYLLPYTQVSLRLQNRLVVALAHTFSLCNHEAEALSGRENGNSGKDVIFARTVSPRRMHSSLFWQQLGFEYVLIPLKYRSHGKKMASCLTLILFWALKMFQIVSPTPSWKNSFFPLKCSSCTCVSVLKFIS